ncbi:MAG: EscU/YscU/HrcU family type III secretion system export apparatus switch protein [Deltaproteobacteria bacterium]|nr:EscU/YscU/HrcU family type III secretion system export apparatus switch protein [Deltaproteobacteria bacterium]
MTDQTEKPFSPPPSRVSAAAQQGLLLQSNLLWFGVILVAAGLTGVMLLKSSEIFSPHFLADALSQTQPAAYLMVQLHKLFFFCLTMALPAMGVGLAAIILVRRQKRHGQTNVVINKTFGSRRDDVVVNSLTLLVSMAAGVALVRNGGFSFLEIELAPASTARRLAVLFLWCCITMGAVTVIGGCIQLVMRRIRLFQHLSLTRAEMEREQRLQGESPVRARLKRSGRRISTVE